MDDPLSAIVTFRDATSLLDQYADSETRVLLIETLLSIPNHASDAVQGIIRMKSYYHNFILYPDLFPHRKESRYYLA